MPLATLDDAERGRFPVGKSFFRSNWVEFGASTTARVGLGPHFDARSCGACHVQDGRGQPNLGAAGGLLLRLSVPGATAQDPAQPHPVYGEQLQTQAVQGVAPKGRWDLVWETLELGLLDGAALQLQRPRAQPSALAYGPLDATVMFSLRLAPQLMGVGLIDAIPDAALLRHEAAQARRQDGIRGQAHRVWDIASQRQRIGRFGWKAGSATLMQQTAAAFAGDIGITSHEFPGLSCTAAQLDCWRAPQGPQPEISPQLLGEVVFYQAALAPVAQRQLPAAVRQQGQRLFEKARCAVCHHPSYRTEQPPFPALSPRSVAQQTIWPYSDFLLHDMGDGLADGRPEGQASGRQWRTPPLWGLGLLREVNGHQRLLHDGRANGVLEAIWWHDGEARGAREATRRMTPIERDMLVRFVESL
jgi:CxxC motif-containing protein (DUF1111 family)